MSELEVLDRGEFTLNPERALELLGDKLLPTRHHYLLLWVQAAYLLGAPELTISVGWFSIRLHFSPIREIGELNLAQQIPLGSDRALQALALGVRVASRGTGKVTLQTSHGSQVFSKDGSWAESGCVRQGVVLSVTRFRWDHSFELLLLSQACAWSPIPISLNGRDLRLKFWGDSRTLVERYLAGEGLSAPGASLAQRPHRVPLEQVGQRVSSRLALSLSGRQSDAALTWVRHAVVIGESQRDLEVPGLCAVICVDDLPTDLTGFGLLEGPELQKRIDEVRVEALVMKESMG